MQCKMHSLGSSSGGWVKEGVIVVRGNIHEIAGLRHANVMGANFDI